MERKLSKMSLVITKKVIGEMIGIRNEGVDIMAEEKTNDAEMLKEREAEEIKSRGFGKGELQGPFVEEEDD
ncbi:hypothetical protein Tco_1177781 [Tanacetum coccineum]